MRITKVETVAVRLPYFGRQEIATPGVQEFAENTIVRIGTDEGIEGIGEAPGSSYGGMTETLAIQKDVMDRHFREELIGENPLETRHLMDKLNANLKGYFSIKGGIDMALHDLKGKCLQVPVHTLLGGKVRDSIPLEWSLGRGKSVEELVEKAADAVKRGHEYLEVKVGRSLDLESDIARARAVREAVGPQPKIKVDFNQGYMTGGTYPLISSILRFVESLGEARIDYIEQPLPAWDLDGLAYLRQRINIPIILDESAYSPITLLEAIKKGCGDAVHVKVMKGGYLELQKMVCIAEAAGLTVIPGGGLPFGVGLAAIHQYVAAFSCISYGTHGSRARLFKDEIVTEPVKLEPTTVVSDKPGLGVTLDEDVLKKYTIQL